jgi:NAD(P)-dependent dehydrogenase (short-subunit alcohol dehydrogenase family)
VEFEGIVAADVLSCDAFLLFESDKNTKMAASKIIVITGANAGLGYHCAQQLAKSDSVSTIILACRNTTAAKKAAEEIRASAALNLGLKNIVVLEEPCDLSDLKSTRAYCVALNKWLNGRKIATLVNNAGIGGSTQCSRNAEGHEKIFATNHLGHFLLTILLLPSVTDRIINVSSEVHDPAKKTSLPDPEIGYPSSTEEYNSRLLAGHSLEGESESVSEQRRYSRSKLCNIFFTNELAFRLSGDIPTTLEESVAAKALVLPQRAICKLPDAKKIRCLSFNPGLMLDSNFATSAQGPILGAIAYFLTPVLRLTPVGPLIRTAPLSGGRLAKLSLGEIGGGTTASYYYDESAVPSSAFSRSSIVVTKLQKELWDLSIVWAGVTAEDLAAAAL